MEGSQKTLKRETYVLNNNIARDCCWTSQQYHNNETKTLDLKFIFKLIQSFKCPHMCLKRGFGM